MKIYLEWHLSSDNEFFEGESTIAFPYQGNQECKTFNDLVTQMVKNLWSYKWRKTKVNWDSNSWPLRTWYHLQLMAQPLHHMTMFGYPSGLALWASFCLGDPLSRWDLLRSDGNPARNAQRPRIAMMICLHASATVYGKEPNMTKHPRQPPIPNTEWHPSLHEDPWRDLGSFQTGS